MIWIFLCTTTGVGETKDNTHLGPQGGYQVIEACNGGIEVMIEILRGEGGVIHTLLLGLEITEEH